MKVGQNHPKPWTDESPDVRNIAAGLHDRVDRMSSEDERQAMGKIYAVLGALSGFVAVASGAFGVHVLRQKLPADDLAVFETAARYEMYHALALLGVAWALNRWPGIALQVAGMCFVAGTLLFCGSLYILALSGIRWFGAITPLGGLAFLAGWLSLAWGILKSR